MLVPLKQWRWPGYTTQQCVHNHCLAGDGEKVRSLCGILTNCLLSNALVLVGSFYQFCHNEHPSLMLNGWPQRKSPRASLIPSPKEKHEGPKLHTKYQPKTPSLGRTGDTASWNIENERCRPTEIQLTEMRPPTKKDFPTPGLRIYHCEIFHQRGR